MITQAREHVAAALTAAGVPCQAYPPATITPPAALLYPADPYVEGTQLGACTVGLRVRLIVASAAPSSTRALDALIDAAGQALRQSGIRVGAVAAITSEEQATYLHTDVPITVTWED